MAVLALVALVVIIGVALVVWQAPASPTERYVSAELTRARNAVERHLDETLLDARLRELEDP